MTDNSSITDCAIIEMDFTKLSKRDLLVKCAEHGITKCKTKNKGELIDALQNKVKIISNTQNEITIENNAGTIENNSGIEHLDVISNDVTNKVAPYKFIDLFCGIGGFHQALKRLGCECVLACDIDAPCREVYKNNYNIEPISNVKDIDENNMVDFDILCAGFPCQAFSNGGKKNCFADKRGLLFDEIIRIAKVKKPKFMFLENVKHILKVSDGKVIEYIKDNIKKTGYTLQLFQISPHNYGIPQQRERVYFVCVRNDLYNGNNIELPKFNGLMDFTKFLDKKEDINEKYYIKNDILDVLDGWNIMIKQFQVGEKISPTIMMNDAYRNYTDEEFAAFPYWKKDYITKNKPLLEKYDTLFREWYEKHSILLQKREIYGKLEWQTGPICENESIYNHFIQLRQSGIRVKKSKYFPTLVAISQIPIYGKEKRYITPRECARLQSFPDTFILSKDDKHSYKQLGNSVNVDNVYTVISSTLNHYGSSCI